MLSLKIKLLIKIVQVRLRFAGLSLRQTENGRDNEENKKITTNNTDERLTDIAFIKNFK